jgi:hypothetical protein
MTTLDVIEVSDDNLATWGVVMVYIMERPAQSAPLEMPRTV